MFYECVAVKKSRNVLSRKNAFDLHDFSTYEYALDLPDSRGTAGFAMQRHDPPQ